MARMARRRKGTMKTFVISEYGQEFARIQARDAIAALRKAADEFPRRASDYNCEPGEKSTTEWRAVEHVEDGDDAMCFIRVPSRGRKGIIYIK